MSVLFKNPRSKKNIIFVIGTGRSGTHLLGRAIGSLLSFDAYIEDAKSFHYVTRVCVDPKKNPKQIKKVIKLYKNIFEKSEKKFILEKTHSNIWLVEDLIKSFKNAKFIGIKRNVFATVASMLKHPGVLRWYDVLPLNEPNPFLGITDKNRDKFKDLPLESKCALRWKSHNDRLEYLQEKFPKEVLIINYEDFYFDNENLIKRLESFIGVDEPIKTETLNTESLEKWKSSLSKEEIRNIEIIISE